MRLLAVTIKSPKNIRGLETTPGSPISLEFSRYRTPTEKAIRSWPTLPLGKILCCRLLFASARAIAMSKWECSRWFARLTRCFSGLQSMNALDGNIIEPIQNRVSWVAGAGAALLEGRPPGLHALRRARPLQELPGPGPVSKAGKSMQEVSYTRI